MTEQPSTRSLLTQGDRPLSSPQSPYCLGWFDWFCLWYPPGWLILFNRHWQHYHADPEGWNWLEYILFLIPGGFYLAWLIRWLRLGCRAPQVAPSIVEPDYQRAFRQEILVPIVRHYFRAELHHAERLPPTGAAIALMNHAGMCFPWDIISLGVLLGETRGWTAQPVAHPIFFDHPWLRWWLPPGWLQSLRGVRAEFQPFETALQTQAADTVLLYAPEGWHGIAKGWQRRYQLATFDPSFVRLSDRYRVPLLPVACVGNESLHPWTLNIRAIARWLGLPMFPLSPYLIPFLLFPSMGVWANRTRLRYYIQPLVQLWQEPDLPSGLQTRSGAYQRAQELRAVLQDRIQEAIALPPNGDGQEQQSTYRWNCHQQELPMLSEDTTNQPSTDEVLDEQSLHDLEAEPEPGSEMLVDGMPLDELVEGGEQDESASSET